MSHFNGIQAVTCEIRKGWCHSNNKLIAFLSFIALYVLKLTCDALCLLIAFIAAGMFLVNGEHLALEDSPSLYRCNKGVQVERTCLPAFSVNNKPASSRNYFQLRREPF